ncbi:hypothetical protein [Microbulbifer agarilyticus]|uniref:hypothetical protein n=1 Tax=Microbulbifer agarilyticus TaxID=260552 RepID=UPI001CD7B4AB|nr:hypothetical protein [Microbulbifer agarilyticus]MCA0892472.1 hypothetical protein [Microbulbifer agarilyticus]MCA0899164.1 hypothetical protein [Microbulbifer agarilyticus]
MMKGIRGRWLETQSRPVRVAVDVAAVLCTMAVLLGAVTAEAATSAPLFEPAVPGIGHP